MKDKQNKKSQSVKIVTGSHGVHATDDNGSVYLLPNGEIYSTGSSK
ncbi:hypothetical protein [Lactobacillus intestinalis]|nr:hypothetical protein [Lactobacillus intestinalis]